MRMIYRTRKRNDCGIVAAFNACAWSNKYKPYKEIEKVAKSCGYSSKRGMYQFQFSYLMKKLNIPAKKINPQSVKDIEADLYAGKCFVLIYTPMSSDVGHAITAFMDHKGKIRILNPDKYRRNWYSFVSNIHECGMKELNVYDVPRKAMVKRNDVNRAA